MRLSIGCRRLGSLALLAMVCAVLFFGGGCRSAVEKLEREGDASLQNGEFSQAAALYGEAILESDEPGRLHAKRARAYELQGDFAAALADFDQAIQTSNDAGLRRERAMLALKAGEWDKAVDDYSFLIEALPNDSACLLGRGEALLALSQVDRALDDLSQAVNLDPNSEAPLLARGTAYLKKEAYEQAESDFSAVINKNPRAGQAFWKRSLARSRLGKRASAEQDRERALALEPGLGFSQSTLGESLLNELGGRGADEYGVAPLETKLDR